mmetsp:Transcript_33268/g.105205  ORF Transcript_33268/g.105205 Transcript_33268/m.105205 type:complete len:302 (-) Transcript_33268:186-1091(-)
MYTSSQLVDVVGVIVIQWDDLVPLGEFLVRRLFLESARCQRRHGAALWHVVLGPDDVAAGPGQRPPATPRTEGYAGHRPHDRADKIPDDLVFVFGVAPFRGRSWSTGGRERRRRCGGEERAIRRGGRRQHAASLRRHRIAIAGTIAHEPHRRVGAFPVPGKLGEGDVHHEHVIVPELVAVQAHDAPVEAAHVRVRRQRPVQVHVRVVARPMLLMPRALPGAPRTEGLPGHARGILVRVLEVLVIEDEGRGVHVVPKQIRCVARLGNHAAVGPDELQPHARHVLADGQHRHRHVSRTVSNDI